jgi:hypothetical protein
MPAVEDDPFTVAEIRHLASVDKVAY